MVQNPYTLMFGRLPGQVISRVQDTDQIISVFTDPVPSQQVYMLTGVRGSGKTVMLSEIIKRMKILENWIIVELNPGGDLLKNMLSKLCSIPELDHAFQLEGINLSFFGLGVDLQGKTAVKDEETALLKTLETVKKKGKRVLIAIDEAFSSPAMREFTYTFQILARHDLPVFLLMTGLYDNIDALQNADNLTFLYRAPKIVLSPLSIRRIASNYRDVFEVNDQTAHEMALLTRGYSFAFQVLGYFTWEHKGDYRKALGETRNYLFDYSYDKIWSELSPEDRRVSWGIASAGSERVTEIRKKLHMDTNHLNPYRKRLIRKGIVNGDVYGHMSFMLPFFEEYVLENYDGTDQA